VPYSKYLRNTLKEGVKDTFNIMMGHQNYLARFAGEPLVTKSHYGITDLFLFPLVSRSMLHYGLPTKELPTGKWVKDREKTSSFRYVIGFIGLLLQLPRLALAITLTIVALPLVCIIHCIKFPFIKYYENKFYKLQGYKNDCSNYTLNDYVKLTKSSLNDLEINTDKNLVKSNSENNSTYNPQAKAYRHNTFFSVATTTSKVQKEALAAATVLGL
jgi:hypothetical protein